MQVSFILFYRRLLYPILAHVCVGHMVVFMQYCMFKTVYFVGFQVKCEKYWPGEGSKMYGDIEVTLMKIENFAHHVTHILQLKKVGKWNVLTVLHNNAIERIITSLRKAGA